MSGVTVVLLSKPAVAGRVKTRMTSRWSASDAASLHECLLADVLEQLVAGVAVGAYRVEVAWALEALPGGATLPADDAPDLSHPLLRVPPQVSLCSSQSGGDLGARIHQAMVAAGERGADIVMAVGSDHPELDQELVLTAGRAIENGADVAVAPSHDGGYGLLAIRTRALRSELFQGIDWSTERVFAQTRDRVREAGLQIEVLATLHDVDRPEDLEALMDRLDSGPDVGLARRTRAWAHRHGVAGASQLEVMS